MPHLTLWLRGPHPHDKGAVDWHLKGEEDTDHGTVAADELGALIERIAPDGASWPQRPECVTVFVPTADTLSIRCRVPGRNTSRIRRALPFAIEEFITGEIEALHIATDTVQPNEPIQTLCAGIPLMEEWLELLRGAGLEPGVMTADAFALPTAPNLIAVRFDDESDTATVRTPMQVACVDRANLAMILPGLRADIDDGNAADAEKTQAAAEEEHEAGEQEANPDAEEHGAEEHGAEEEGDEGEGDQTGREPELLLLDGALAADELHEAGFEQEAVRSTQIDTSWIEAFAQSDLKGSINLLQGPYAPRRSMSGAGARWRSAAGLAAGIAIFVFAVFGAEGYWAHLQADALRTEAKALYQEIFGNPAAGNPVLRMRRELGRDSSEAVITFEQFTSALAHSLNQAVEDYTLRSLSYSRSQGALIADLSVPDYAALDDLEQAVIGQGFGWTLNAAQRDEDRVRARIMLRKPG